MITLGGSTDTALGFTVLGYDTIIPALPDTRDYTLEIAGRHGFYDFGAEMQPRMFIFNCYFTDDQTFAEIQAAIRTLNAHLLDNWGKPETLTLIFDDESDKYYNVRYSGSQSIDATAAMNRRKFTLPLIAFEPYAFAAETTDTDSITTSPQTLTYTVTSGLNVPVTMILDNNGAATISGFSFKTYNTLVEYDYYA